MNVTERNGQAHVGTLLVNLKDLLLPLQFGFALSPQMLAYEIQFAAPPR